MYNSSRDKYWCIPSFSFEHEHVFRCFWKKILLWSVAAPLKKRSKSQTSFDDDLRSMMNHSHNHCLFSTSSLFLLYLSYKMSPHVSLICIIHFVIWWLLNVLKVEEIVTIKLNSVQKKISSNICLVVETSSFWRLIYQLDASCGFFDLTFEWVHSSRNFSENNANVRRFWRKVIIAHRIANIRICRNTPYFFVSMYDILYVFCLNFNQCLSNQRPLLAAIYLYRKTQQGFLAIFAQNPLLGSFVSLITICSRLTFNMTRQ